MRRVTRKSGLSRSSQCSIIIADAPTGAHGKKGLAANSKMTLHRAAPIQNPTFATLSAKSGHSRERCSACIG
jgi:hypothetical protein